MTMMNEISMQTVWDKLNKSYYDKITVKLTSMPSKPLVPINPSANDLRLLADKMDAYDADLQHYKDQRVAYMQEQNKLQQEFRNDLEAYYGVTNHPKADLLYDMAWDRGHSAGFLDVANYYSDLVRLIKD